MRGLAALVRQVVRGRSAALAWLALFVAVGFGTALASLTAAWRTDHAYPTYLDEAGVSELVVNPSLVTDRMATLIAAAPGVAAVTSDSMLVATLDDGAPRTRGEVDSQRTQLRVSSDGRYTESDRPAVHEGRMVDGEREAFVSLETADELGIEVGDELPIAFWPAENLDLSDADPSDLVRPLGHATVTVVGVGVFADEVLADDLYPRLRVLVTDDVTAPYDCTPRHPDDETQTVEQLVDQLVPPDCSLFYRYFSLRADGGDAGAAVLAQSLIDLADRESDRLPPLLGERDVRFYMVPAVRAEERARVQRSLEPTVRALALFGVAAGVSTLALSVLTAARVARQARPQAEIWRHIGAGGWQTTGAVAGPLTAAAGCGAAVAIGLAWLASSIGPMGRARLVDPDPGLVVVPEVVLPFVAVALPVLAAGIAGATLVSQRPDAIAGRRRSRTVAAAAGTGNVPLTLGMRAAVAGSGALGVLVTATATVAAITASVIFSTNVGTLLTSPSRFGWPYDAMVVTGFGYGGADPDAVAATLDRPDVEAWGIAGVGMGAVEDQATPFIAARQGFDDLPLELVSGALPEDDDDVGLGVQSAQRLGVTVGDRVTVTTAYGARTGTVSGLVVLPPLGPIIAERAGLGTGVYLPAPFFERTIAPKERADGLPPGTFADAVGSFIAIDLGDGVDPDHFLAEHADEIGAGWDRYGWTPFFHAEPVRPAPIADVSAMRSAPVLLTGLLMVAMAGGLMLTLGLAARTRRRELAVLRALGGTNAQVRSSLRWQAVAIVATGLLAGLPLGAALGRVAWRSFAHSLGVVPAPELSAGPLALLVGAALALALVAGAVPGRLAARNSPSAVLRDQ